MGGQVALALVLLVGSGLMMRSFQKLRAHGSWLRRRVCAHVPHRIAGERISEPRARRSPPITPSSMGCRRCPASRPSPRSTCLPLAGAAAAMAIRCAVRRSHRWRRAARRRSSSSARWPAATSRRWECGCSADAASIEVTSSASEPNVVDQPGDRQRATFRTRIRSASASLRSGRRSTTAIPRG